MKMAFNKNFFLFIVCIFNFSFLLISQQPINTIEQEAQEKNIDILPIEDLMREHGVLDRLLLIFEKCINMIAFVCNYDYRMEILKSSLFESLIILHNFIENYHEKLEEEYIFPIFLRNNQEIELVNTLLIQHNQGRKITRMIIGILKQEPLNQMRYHDKQRIKHLLRQFIAMYRPHAAREDTELFPKLHLLITKEEFDSLGEIFEQKEHQLFGQHGFEDIVKKIEEIEKKLGIYQLEQFTPMLF